MDSLHVRGYVPLLLLLAAIWGASFMFIKIAVDELAPTTTMALRLVLSAIPLLAIIFVNRGLRPALAEMRSITSRDSPWDHQHRAAVHPHRLGRDEDRLGCRGDRERFDADLRRGARDQVSLERAATGVAAVRGRPGPVRRGRSRRCRPRGRVGRCCRNARSRRSFLSYAWGRCIRRRCSTTSQPGARRDFGHVGHDLAPADRRRAGSVATFRAGSRRVDPRARAARHRRRPADLLPPDLQLRLRPVAPRRLPVAGDRALLRRAVARRADHRSCDRGSRADPDRDRARFRSRLRRRRQAER